MRNSILKRLEIAKFGEMQGIRNGVFKDGDMFKETQPIQIQFVDGKKTEELTFVIEKSKEDKNKQN